ncbi:lysophospholipase [Pseudonocardia sp. DSM 110487]|uniref:alpha/beta hydrolase n=1 Tax=Pseudonocardia sp. DSM 110487 TaxID=2865833 RepID=UPI001C69F00C|nr:lysophospholipase [Pseudonocardia sp. DSM 110487]QYN39389.1 lysophospholipase [Pseudonocardia sp. DSM 110487]
MTSAGAVPDIAEWNEPEGIAPRGTLIVLPGRGEHPGVYERFGRRIAADGYRVRAVSDPTLDEARTREQVRALLTAAGPEPRVLAGSDAGALFAAGLAATEPGVAALVLAGLVTEEGGSRGATWDDELDARTACPTHRGRLTDDDAVRRGALAERVPPEWLVRAKPEAIGVPVLGVHGADDAVSPLAAARAWYRRVPSAELVSIAGGRHDALNDQTHRTAAATVVLFLERLRVGADAPALARAEDLR